MSNGGDQQAGIIRLAQIGANYGIVRSLFAQLVRCASKHPSERIEPKDRCHNTGLNKSEPV